MTRVLVAGLGDTGVLTAAALVRRRPDLEVVAVAPTTALVSGQELGLRLADPDRWAADYLVEHRRLRRLDGVDVRRGLLVGADLEGGSVELETPTGERTRIDHDLLVVATGVGNGFWRQPRLDEPDRLREALSADHDLLAEVAAAGGRLVVVGGGAAAVSAAYHLARRWPDLTVELCFPGERALPQHHGRVWARVGSDLEEVGVVLRPGHRAVLPPVEDLTRLAPGTVAWSTGQPGSEADLVLWAVGRVRPHTGWLPQRVLDEDGFVRTGRDLRVRDADGDPVEGVFAIGDVAATDPLRSSARNFAHRVLAANIDAHLRGRPLKDADLPPRRWGSVLGPQPGLDVYDARGRRFRFPAWVNDRVLQGLVVRRVFYGGVRPTPATSSSGHSHGTGE